MSTSNSYSVLIVDDSAVMRRMVRRILIETGLPIGLIREATTGMEALGGLAEAPADLLLLDINMPEPDGLEVLARIRRHPQFKSLPVVMISTEGSEPRIQRIAELKASFVRKPFRADDLRVAIDHVLQREAA
jgi:two-component system chemotaxis response regulator CheY